MKITDKEWDAMTTAELIRLGSPPLDDDGVVDEPGHPCYGTPFKSCWGAREEIERAIDLVHNPLRDCWWAL